MTFAVDVKSVNHRYLEVVFRLPREWSHAEDRLRKLVQSRVKRGRVEAVVSVERAGGRQRQASVDWELAAAYADAARQAAERFGLPPERGLTAAELLNVPGVFAVREDALPDDAEDTLAACVEAALEKLTAMRETEGRFLAEDALARLDGFEALVGRMEAASATVVDDYRTKLQERIGQLLGGNIPVDPDRIAAEVAFFAERAGIDEELTRLRSHASQFRELLRSDEPAGRKLDFLLQEMNRETNTIGSKANKAELSAMVVEAKAELEKLREQVQNFE